MKKTEKNLFKSLCSFKSTTFDEALLKDASPEVLGHLFFNRMQAVAYGTLEKHGLLGKVNREFRNSLKGAYEQNLTKNKSFYRCVQYLNGLLDGCGCRYAMLKGALLCRYYPIAYRTANDIDLLVMPNDVTAMSNILQQAGFAQGHIRNGVFEPATRRDIIASKMMRGETIPYIKQIDLPGMKYLEVDINFSLDYKPGDTQVLEEMLNRVYTRSVNKLKVTTLDQADFFIHLCSHLYKEATTLPWVEMQRDMTLYKYSDIYLLLDAMDEKAVDLMFSRAKKLGMEKICAFAIRQSAALFELKNQYALSESVQILKEDEAFLHTVFSPQNKKVYRYTNEDIAKRFFTKDRTTLLEEVLE